MAMILPSFLFALRVYEEFYQKLHTISLLLIKIGNSYLYFAIWNYGYTSNVIYLCIKYWTQ